MMRNRLRCIGDRFLLRKAMMNRACFWYFKKYTSDEPNGITKHRSLYTSLPSKGFISWVVAIVCLTNHSCRSLIKVCRIDLKPRYHCHTPDGRYKWLKTPLFFSWRLISSPICHANDRTTFFTSSQWANKKASNFFHPSSLFLQCKSSSYFSQ